MGDKSWAARVAIVGAVGVVGATLWLSRSDLQQFDWLRLFARISGDGWVVVAYTSPFFVLGGTLIGWKGAYRLGAALAVIGMSYAVVLVIYYVVQNGSYVEPSHAPLILRLFSEESNVIVLISLSLLSVQRFQGRLDRARIVAFASLILLLAAHLLTFWNSFWLYHLWVEVARAAATCGTFGLMIFVAWCAAFRQVDSPFSKEASA